MKSQLAKAKYRSAAVMAVVTGVAVMTAVVSSASTYTASAQPILQKRGKCGLGNGKKAKGTPIKIGAVVTVVPGVDFSLITNITKAYFDCVNDNGGINGRPVAYTVANDSADPQAASQAAHKLIDNDHVLGMAGGTSLVDCSANHKYYKQKGFDVIVAGVPPECYTSPNIAAVNQGPYYDTAAQAQYAIKYLHAKSVVATAANQPGFEHVMDGAVVVAKAAGLPSHALHINVPITDPTSLALKLSQLAGPGGAILVDFTADQTVPILQAAQQQGLMDKVHWLSGSAANDRNVEKALGSKWDGKLPIVSEFNLVDAKGPDSALYRAVAKKYAPHDTLSNFGQMGFLAGKFMTEALLRVAKSGKPFTVKTVNAAVRSLVGIKTDVLCKPWYFGNLRTHLPNNWSLTVGFKNGKIVPLGKCFADPVTNPIIKQARADEKKLHLP